jgi:vancomycin resistance protein YoaR
VAATRNVPLDGAVRSQQPQQAFVDLLAKVGRWIRTRRGKWSLVVGVVLLGLVAAAYGADLVVHSGKVLPGVSVGKTQVGGVTLTTARQRLENHAEAVNSRPIPIRVESANLEIVPVEAGIGLDSAKALDQARNAGRHGLPWIRVYEWAQARLFGRTVDWEVTVDEKAATEAIRSLDFPGHSDVVEPTVTWEDLEPVVTPPAVGRQIDTEKAIHLIRARILRGGDTRLELPSGLVRPRYDETDALVAAERAKSEWLTAPVTVTLLGASMELEPEDVTDFLGSHAGRDGFRVKVDESALAENLPDHLPDGVGTPAVDASYRIENGASVVVPGSEGIGCCAKGSGAALERALSSSDPRRRVVQLRETRLVPHTTAEDLAAFGPLSRLSSFTTKHPAGGARVENIHKLADIMRGVVLMPGETFSINDHVGPRTKAKGWLAAKVIEDGVYAQSPGGGISQFATTLYNALYWAGLQIDEHKPHSIYISRYPRGREATLGYPKPDLVFTNTSPGPVLIWPSYTASSITVELWGINDGRVVEALPQKLTRQGACRIVKDTRVIRWPDGREETDRYTTYYRPEGQSC